MSDVLIAREERIRLLQEQMVDDNVYLVVKANTPGFDKRVFSGYFLARFFKKYLVRAHGAKELLFMDSLDGPYYILKTMSTSGEQVKKEMVEIEEDHPLGRFIDIDVYQHQTISMRRESVGFESRKCFLCEEEAIVCRRSNKHTLEELFSHIDQQILQFLYDDFRYLIYDSITLEAMLHPKFGLVTEQSSGSHDDMDFELLAKAKEAITDYIALMVLQGFVYDLDKAFMEAREIGKAAEESMFSATGGVNCYKGLIFVLGLAALGVGYAIRNQKNKQAIFDSVAYMCKDILLEFQEEHQDTFGKKAFFEYGFTGIRGEVRVGLETVQKALPVLSRYTTYSEEALTMTLIEIMRYCEDTVLLKRAGSMERYLEFKEKITSIIDYNKEQIEQVTNEAIASNISIGGGADLLVVTIFIHKVLERYIDEDAKEAYRRV